jgi:hypothetical protein
MNLKGLAATAQLRRHFVLGVHGRNVVEALAQPRSQAVL